MTAGNRPADGGHLIIEAEDYQEFATKEPQALPFIKKLTGAREYINNIPRWCLWLVDVSPAQIRKLPLVRRRVELCRQDRLAGALDRQKLAETPALFRETLNPEHYILIPYTSSENREYIPLGFLDKDTIPTDSASIIIDAGMYEFAVLSSSVHMTWIRAVAGRLKSDFRYSKDIVYNNFPWPQDLDAALKTQIEQAGAAIIEARKQYPDSSLADLYDKTVMPPVLHKAHQHNDALVLKAYGLPADAEPAEILSVLLTQYQTLSTGAKRAIDTAAADKSADQNKKTTQIPTKENKPC